jgi:hypothetical protein
MIFDPPAAWRTRFEAIRHLLRDPERDLCAALAEADREVLDLDARDRVTRYANEHRDLLPDEAGDRVALALLAGCSPLVERVEWSGATVRIFDQPVPPYVARLGGRRRAFAPRNRNTAQTKALLRLLNIPVTYKEAASRTGLTPHALCREISRLRKRRGLRIRPSKDQTLICQFYNHVRQWEDHQRRQAEAQLSGEQTLRTGERRLTVGCTNCDWTFQGPEREALDQQQTHRNMH